jgi:ParB-like chromosome segregation protein Spo0J
VKPYPNNPRTNDAGVDAVAASLREFGWQQPLVVDEQGVLIVGHTRLKAAAKLGMKTAPVHVARGLTPEQVKAYRVADNSTATLSAWDDGKLAAELMELQRADYDLGLTGLAGDDLLRLLTQPTELQGDPDDVPEPVLVYNPALGPPVVPDDRRAASALLVVCDPDAFTEPL